MTFSTQIERKPHDRAARIADDILAVTVEVPALSGICI
jgi:hypothetical protein